MECAQYKNCMDTVYPLLAYQKYSHIIPVLRYTLVFVLYRQTVRKPVAAPPTKTTRIYLA